MDPAAFRSPTSGAVIRMPTGYAAFVPAPLPPAITYDQELVLALSRADTALGELSAFGAQLPNPHILIAPYMRQEAVLSSRIEGTRATISDLFLQEVKAAPQDVPADVREVQNYITALEYGIARLDDLPLSLRLVREIHERLMAGVRGQHATPGEFRRSQNWIGPPGYTLNTAPYVPPPPDRLMEALSDWEHFLHVRNTMPDLIQCAIMHQQFESIHPFLDGNGRIGRLLIILFLKERDRLSQPLLYLSAYFEAHRDDYYDLLQRVRTEGDWERWIRFFLDGVAETAHGAGVQAGLLLGLRELFRQRLVGKPKALALVDELLINPFITVARAATVLGSSRETARQAVRLLEREELLYEVSGRSWGRVYVAHLILEAIQRPPEESERMMSAPPADT
jgi:Fic family protein